MDAHLGVFAIGVHAIGRDKGAGSAVEDMKETFVERQACTQDGGDEQVVLGQRDVEGAEGRGHGLGFVSKRLGKFKGHHLAYTLYVGAEEVAVALKTLIAQLAHVLVDDGVALAEIDDIHSGMGL